MFVEVLLFVLCLLPVLPLFFVRSKKVIGEPVFKKVVICVAARNEEGNIAGCLDALLRLNYPKELLDIRIGNIKCGECNMEQNYQKSDRREIKTGAVEIGSVSCKLGNTNCEHLKYELRKLRRPSPMS